MLPAGLELADGGPWGNPAKAQAKATNAMLPGLSGPPGSATYTPDYQSIINNDPAFQAIKNSISAQGIQDAAQRAAGTNQALIQFGAVPNFGSLAASLGLSPSALQMLQGDINSGTAALAANNPYSTEKQLQRQEDQAMLALRNGLAARGGLSSGEDAYQTGNQNYAYGLAQQNALNSLLGALTGLQGNYLTNQANEQNTLNQGLQTAEANDSALPQYQGFSLNYNAGSGKYVGPSGETYTPTRQGNSWTLKDDGTGLSYALNPDGSLSLQ